MKKISFRNDVLPLKNELFRLALRITLNRVEAEDVVQETMIKVWNRRDRWEELESIEAFCLTICRNIAIDKTNLTDMVATGGMSVNNVDVMTSAANNSEYSYEFLGGQNPYSVLLDTALKIDNSEIGEDDALINSAFEAAVKAYSEGKVSSIDDAKADFEATLKDFGVV